MKHFLILILLISFYRDAIAQDIQNTNVNELEIIEEVYFVDKTKNTKKIVKKWSKYENISKVYVDEMVDSVFFDFILEEVSKNKNINELTVSLNEDNLKLLKKYNLSHIKSLKIFNSNGLNQNELLKSKLLLRKLHSLTWVNNHQPIDSMILKELINLQKIELIDTLFNFTNDTILYQLSKINKLNELTISFKEEVITYDLNKIKELRTLSLINIEKYKQEFKANDFLNIDESNSHQINDGNKGVKINYYNNDTVLYKNEKRFVIKNLNLNKLQNVQPPIPCEGAEYLIDNKITYKYQREINTDTIFTPIFKKNIKSFNSTLYYVLVDNSMDTIITLESGTKISILKNSFVHNNEELNNQYVTLIYREFSHPLSLFASGIPMLTTIHGNKEILNSAGVFEIRFFHGKKELQIKKESKINIEFASIDDGKKYELFRFDLTNNQWAKINNFIEPFDLDCQFIKNSRAFNNDLARNTKNFISNLNYDTTKFNDRFKNLDYYYLCDKNFKKYKVNYEDGFWLRNRKVRNFRIYNNTITKKKNLVKFNYIPKTKGDSSVFLKINFKIENMKIYFPELAYFNHIIFFNNDYLKIKKFKSIYFKNKIYSDIRVEYKRGNDFCVFILKEKKEFIRIKMYLYDEFTKKPVRQRYYKNTFYRAFLKYQKKLGEREISYNKGLEKSNRNSLKTKFMKLNVNHLNSVLNWSKPLNSKRKVEIDKTGFYNFNTNYENPSAKPFSLNLKNTDNKEIQIKNLFVFEQNANTYIGYNSYNVMLDSLNLIGIIAITENGEIYYINKNEISNLNFQNDIIEIFMRKNEEKIDSLQKAINLFLKN